ncbi:Tryptophan synthase alpha chain [Labilithrix luteola]|uniref:Tryptophan synthase alpha chain n=1 Tax=Labilithrix luteola TaxID=1391654 RepID=A0A0K1PR35_9BACT|nr:hypothetical protein [Labilithrix luteola]AKU95993.1 Tryptophan synthase alpha chain [Labilithrix luteola]
MLRSSAVGARSWTIAVLGLAALGVAGSIVLACGIDEGTRPDGTDAAPPTEASAATDAEVPDHAEAGLTCRAGLTACGSTCADLQTDKGHCGTCERACTSGQECSSGACIDVCQVDGGTVASGAVDPTNACQVCNTAKARDAWTVLDDGTTCGAGKLCAGGACAAKCLIDGTLYDDGAANPSNGCETCQASVSTTAWTPRAESPLLTGGVDVTTQGWTIIQQAPYTLTYAADYTRLETSTVAGGRTSGQLLLAKSGAIEAGKPFAIRVQMLVESVSGPHDPLDAAVAIMGSLTGPLESTPSAARCSPSRKRRSAGPTTPSRPLSR